MSMKKIKNIISKYPFLKFLVNRYILILIVFGIWMLFFDNYSYLEHRILDKEINEIEDNINYYRSEIKKDSTSIKHLKNDNRVEKYAREKYFMKRENEDIYIIDFEDNMKDSVITKQDKISNN
jgi:cell division protein DivIC